LVAAYNWPGGRADLAYLLARRGVVDLHASSFILGEVDRVLREKFGWEEDRAGRAVAQIRRIARGVHEPSESVAVIEDDRTDNRILECTLAAGAELVVTGDKKHLLPLGSFRDVSIVRLEDFLAAFSAD
jgi:predicted nucleic acid-binding protein